MLVRHRRSVDSDLVDAVGAREPPGHDDRPAGIEAVHSDRAEVAVRLGTAVGVDGQEAEACELGARLDGRQARDLRIQRRIGDDTALLGLLIGDEPLDRAVGSARAGDRGDRRTTGDRGREDQQARRPQHAIEGSSERA